MIDEEKTTQETEAKAAGDDTEEGGIRPSDDLFKLADEKIERLQKALESVDSATKRIEKIHAELRLGGRARAGGEKQLTDEQKAEKEAIESLKLYGYGLK